MFTDDIDAMTIQHTSQLIVQTKIITLYGLQWSSKARPYQSSVVTYQKLLNCLALYTLNTCSYLQIRKVLHHLPEAHNT